MRQAEKFCYKCKLVKPIASFMVWRRTTPMVGMTCDTCRKSRTPKQMLHALVSQCNSRARRMGSAGLITVAEWVNKLEFSGGFCHFCREYKGTDRLTIEHVHRLAYGGTNTIDNVEPACITCNLKRIAKRYHVDQFK